MQALCAQCEYQQIAHATYVGPMCTMWVPTNCPCNLCRFYVHNVGTNKLPMQPMQAMYVHNVQTMYPMCTMWVQIAHATYVAPMFTMWVPTNCPCNLCSPYVHNVGTNKLPMQPMQALCAQCEYQQIAHATYVGPYVHVGTMWVHNQIAHATYVGAMCTMWVPTNCPCNLCRPYVHNVGTNKLPMQPMQALCACEYQQIVQPMQYVHNVGTDKLPMQPMQVHNVDTMCTM